MHCAFSSVAWGVPLGRLYKSRAEHLFFYYPRQLNCPGHMLRDSQDLVSFQVQDQQTRHSCEDPLPNQKYRRKYRGTFYFCVLPLLSKI